MAMRVSKGELNRLGDRLRENPSPSEADFDLLSTALVSYQETLETVKEDLRNLGFSPSGRVKTTKTMIEKLIRTHGMQLSRVQDLAGARIMVRDMTEQDISRNKIIEFYQNSGCSIKVVDRRIDPRFGYRAVHLIPNIDGTPVEIQIRTELQDSWAQIVERLADRWGRGIRYGEIPENPEALVRSGSSTYTRRRAVEILPTLSDAIFKVETSRQSANEDAHSLRTTDEMLQRLREGEYIDSDGLKGKITEEVRETRSAAIEIWNSHPQWIDNECQHFIEAGDDITGFEFVRILEITHGFLQRKLAERAAQVSSLEQELRATIALVANASDEGA